MSSTDFGSSSITSDLSSRFSLSSPPQDHMPVSVTRPQALNISSSIPFERNSLVNRIFGKRKLAKQKEKFFQENGGFLLQQKLSGDYLADETVRAFTEEDIRRATNNYDKRNIWLGAFRTVHRGILPDNRLVAIKKSYTSHQLQIDLFINEVTIVPKINHRNVVKLLGFCLETKTPTLVYEFITNGTLFSHIHDPVLASRFSWDMRIKVAADVAWTLAYLHSAASTPIVHNDVKTENIFLDGTYTAKLGNFGFSRLVPSDHSEVTTLVQGTLGYLHSSKLMEKSDVYSFGVVLAELLTGRNEISFDGPEEERNLAVFFTSAIQEDRIVQILDGNFGIEDRYEQLKQVSKITESCLRLHAVDRPSMKDVAIELEALKLVVNHHWRDEDLDEEEITEPFSYPTTPSKSVAGFPELEMLKYLEDHELREENLNGEETMEPFSYTAIPSNSNAGFLSQQIQSRDYLTNEVSTVFTAETLQRATNNYDERNIISRGGHGTIFKGILPNYGVVSIKKSNIIYQGQIDKYINEVKIVSQIDHQNVVKLLGWCLETEVPLLVYEFIKNGTVFSHIHDPILTSSLSWEMRMKIVAETAAALAFLHTVPIIHGDIKSANILLDETYTAKVSDFGASRFHLLDDSSLHSKVQGTIGYLDPEYIKYGQMTEKSDVYSFGVVLSELLTAQKAISYDRSEEDRILPLYFLNAIRDDRLLQILDKNIVREDKIEQLKRVAKLTEWCLKSRRQERPSMNEVAVELETLRLAENHPWIDAE